MKKKITSILILIIVSAFSLAIGVSAVSTIASTSVTYGDTTVKTALDELMTIANQCPSGALCSKVKLGDYVKMTPTQTTYKISTSSTGYTSEQTINPSELSLWRVIDIKTDGTIDIVSEYTSSTSIYFQGQTGYLNLVSTLNTIANQYSNSKYTIRTRHMGYNGQTATITDTSKFTYPAPWTKSTSNNDNESMGGGDVMYEKDTSLVMNSLNTLVANVAGTTTPADYWLASRYYNYTNSTYYRFGGRRVYTDGTVDYNSLYYYHNNVFATLPYNRNIRPIITLRSDITSYSGAGTSASPWVLS